MWPFFVISPIKDVWVWESLTLLTTLGTLAETFKIETRWYLILPMDLKLLEQEIETNLHPLKHPLIHRLILFFPFCFILLSFSKFLLRIVNHLLHFFGLAKKMIDISYPPFVPLALPIGMNLRFWGWIWFLGSENRGLVWSVVRLGLDSSRIKFQIGCRF